MQLGYNAVDHTGTRFGMLLAERPEKRVGHQIYWRCICDCGTSKLVRASHLTGGKIISCGCRKIKHGKAHSRAWRIWYGMKRRCFDQSEKCYPDYGGRGITVCPAWLEFSGFYADMGDPPDGFSLERKDVNGNYEASNCAWVPLAAQQANKRSRKAVILDRLSIEELERLLAERRGEGIFG